MKKTLLLILSALMFFSCTSDDSSPEIGVTVYRSDDSFISEVRNEIARAGEDSVPVRILSADNKQQKQNEQIEDFIESGAAAIIVNSVDRTASGVIIEKCMKNDVPLVFFNREPVKDDMAKWDKVYYVGARAEDSGRMAGEILADYWLSHPEADKNGDGVLQFVIIKGETGHQDTELRTEYFTEALTERGIQLEKLHEDTAMWNRDLGRDVMNGFLSYSGETIEAVFANNDDMALGAIEALKDAGYFMNGKYMPVIGIDATPAGRRALRDGTLLGTVFNDAENQGRAAYNIARELAEGRVPTSESIGYELTDLRYVWIPYTTMLKSDLI